MYMFGRRGNVGATLIRDRRRLDGSYVDEPSQQPLMLETNALDSVIASIFSQKQLDGE